jgi:hypothetical protein
MNAELAQLIALATHASAWLAGDRSALADLGPDGQLFRWVADALYVAHDGRTDEDAVGWVEGLQARGIARVRVVIPQPGSQTEGGLTVDDRMLAGFANSGTAWALATGAGPAEAWVGEWGLGDREREDQRIWGVRYRGRQLDGEPDLLVAPVADALAALEAALRHAADFARRGEYMGNWAEVFEDALGTTAEPDGLALLPASAPADARRLSAMAASSWVFGGMGSWNDMGFASDDPMGAEYETVSADLYAAVLGGLSAAANAV